MLMQALYTADLIYARQAGGKDERNGYRVLVQREYWTGLMKGKNGVSRKTAGLKYTASADTHRSIEPRVK
eukprot:COSAG02_NODE_5244_length_4508_cov_42.946700_5_plen_70_part_00